MKKLLAILLICGASPAMAVECVVGVYGGTPGTTGGRIQVALTLLDTLTASFTTTSTVATSAGNTSGTMPAAATLVRVKCDANAHFLIEASPTADTGDQTVNASEPEYFGVTSGDKIAFIATE